MLDAFWKWKHKGATNEALGMDRHGRQIHIYAALYISFVILRTNPTGGHVCDFTARG